MEKRLIALTFPADYGEERRQQGAHARPQIYIEMQSLELGRVSNPAVDLHKSH